MRTVLLTAPSTISHTVVRDQLQRGFRFESLLGCRNQTVAHRSLLAAAVEGEDEVFLFGTSGRHLSLQGRLPIPGVLLPCTLAFDRHDNLWAAGSCAPELPLTLGAVSATWLRPNAVVSVLASSGTADQCTAQNLTEGNRATWYRNAPGLQHTLGLRMLLHCRMLGP